MRGLAKLDLFPVPTSLLTFNYKRGFSCRQGPGGGQIGSPEAASIPQSTDPHPYLVARGVHSSLGSGTLWGKMGRIKQHKSPKLRRRGKTTLDAGFVISSSTHGGRGT